MFKLACIVTAIACVPAARAAVPYFNIDLDSNNIDPPNLGNGVPSPAFGAAPGQAGVWNLFPGLSNGPIPLVDLSGAATGVTLSQTGTQPLTCLDFFNPTNTGDYSLLLNDASQAGSLFTGGSLTFTFSGIANGFYQLYTYAAAPQGILSASTVFVPGSTSTNPQLVTGPETGNAFAFGITHSIHDITVTNNTLVVTISAPPGLNDPAYIAGFQIVPAPGGAALIGIGVVGALRRRRGG